MSGNNNYAVVINFYEKVDPPPTFPTFVDGWHNLGKFVKKLDYFVATQLHSNVDPNGKLRYLISSFSVLFYINLYCFYIQSKTEQILISNVA